MFSNHERYFWPLDGGTLAPLRVVDNQSWYQAMNIVDFLSTVGRYFRIGTSFLPRLCGMNFRLDPDSVSENVPTLSAVLRIRIHRIHVFFGLLDPDPDPLVRGMDPDPDPALDPDPDPSIIMQK